MSTATTIAMASSVQSSIVINMAIQAEKKACGEAIKKYDAKTANVVEMKKYASCVEMLYPSEMRGQDILMFKVILVVAFIGMIVGACKGLDAEEMVIRGIAGFFVFPIIIGLVAALVFSALWLLGVI